MPTYVLRRARPVATRGFEQDVGTNDIGFDERRRPGDRTVDMGLGSQVHHRIRLMFAEH
jgi:hypothetical protein